MSFYKKWCKFIAIITVILIFICTVSGIFIFRKEIFSWFNKDEDIYSNADEKICESIVCDNFRNANLEKRQEIALSTLETLEKEDKIKRSSIKYDYTTETYNFEYQNGAEGIIILEDSYNETQTIGNSQYQCTLPNGEVIDDLSSIIEFEDIAYPYKERNLKLAILYDLDNKEIGYNSNYLKGYKGMNDILNEENVNSILCQQSTVETFKTILLNYDYIIIENHGMYSSNTPMICLSENSSKEKDKKYDNDLKEKLIKKAYGGFGGSYYLKPSFFNYYYNNKLKNKIIWIGCCNGFRNDKLVKSFSDCGAKAVIAPTEEILLEYGFHIVYLFSQSLLYGNTVDFSLNIAKSIHGQNDIEYAIKSNIDKKGNDVAEFRYYNGGDATLVTLTEEAKKSLNNQDKEYNNGFISGTVIDEVGNPVKNAGVLAIPNKGNTYKTITDDNGQFIINDCPVDSYRIEVSAEGYELYQSDEFLSTDYVVLEGQEPKSVTIQLKKPIENWQSAYIELLSNLNNSSARFMIAYIDEDDIPELIVSYSSAHVAGCEIYTYYDDKVSKLEGNPTNGEFGSSGEILYSPYKNLFNSRYYGTGSNSDGLFRINNGNAEVECALQHNDYFATVRVIEFKIDGIEVTENEFWDKYNSYEIDSMVSANYDDMVEVNSTNISNYFNNINDAEFSGSGVIDEKKIFTKNQLDEINDNIRETAKNLNMNIMIYLGDSSGWSEEQTKRFADSTYDDIFGVDSDGVFYYMDLSEDSDAYDYISTSGIANNYYNGKIEDMFEEIFKYLPATGEPIVDTQIQSAICQILLVFDEYHDSMS